MPIHNWTRVSAGIFHDFHQGWTIEIRNRLNSGVLPDGYYAMADQRVSGPEPDIIALRLRSPEPKGGLVVAESQAIWDELVGESLGTRPADKPLAVAAYDAGDELTTYVDALAVGDLLPDAPLFLAPGWYVNVPLEQTYMASWDVAPKPIRDLVAPPRTAVHQP
jgi:hypothetical protein